jgi:hypothetical protein
MFRAVLPRAWIVPRQLCNIPVRRGILTKAHCVGPTEVRSSSLREMWMLTGSVARAA